MVTRTKKEFTPYNDYQDRPFGLKWGTAFALPELTKSIKSLHDEAVKYVEELPQMDRNEIDEVLQQAFLKNKVVSIQHNERDELGRLQDSIVSKFTGYADETYLFIDSKMIEWGRVRNVSFY
ncbi:hypothetical protein G7059_06950 [Erysipelothrix sp. HDW6A]|uniref:hypothetical protein n=1 Tax=Erysipelothrix sp. HDW6A TaxID=2714928 RepID=UPI0014076E92|nr:hypothetical protein [Erysipelothrix sp. HDW6A]QIK57597.1 hypothetical protein G7059_06950 [Erysipelothrix sp. HDW6A]